MRHLNDTKKLGKTGSHYRCMMSNMLKSLIFHERIETTIPKAKELRRHADKIITLTKKDDQIHAKRLARAALMLNYNTLTPKERKKAKGGDLSFWNVDRQVLVKLFGQLKERFANRNGGYTRILKTDFRAGDNSPKCFIEFVE